MLFETEDAKCVNCRGQLILRSRSKQWRETNPLYVFVFECENCKRQYESRDGKLSERHVGRDPIAERVAINELEREAAVGRRCWKCGGPIMSAPLRCDWCHEYYIIVEGELLPKPPEPKPKTHLREFANAVYPQR